MSNTTPQDASTTVPANELEHSIAQQISLSTWGRIHDLEVTVSNDSVHVRGRTPSHYIKQLVLHAVYEVIGADSSIRVEFDIQVGKAPRHVLPGNNDLWGVPT